MAVMAPGCGWQLAVGAGGERVGVGYCAAFRADAPEQAGGIAGTVLFGRVGSRVGPGLVHALVIWSASTAASLWSRSLVAVSSVTVPWRDWVVR